MAAILTVIGAACVHLGLNVANDILDTGSRVPTTPTSPRRSSSGGSRVIQYGLVSLRRMATITTMFYLAALAHRPLLLASRGSTALLAIGLVGFIVIIGYTAPPLKFVYRGLGEVAVAIGFGPLMLLGRTSSRPAGRCRGSRSSPRSRSPCSWR